MTPLHEHRHFTAILCFIRTDIHFKFFLNFHFDLSAHNLKYDIKKFTFSRHFLINIVFGFSIFIVSIPFIRVQNYKNCRILLTNHCCFARS